MTSGSYDGRTFVADASAWHRSSNPAVAEAWREALALGQIATCAIVVMEMLYSARDESELALVEEQFSGLRDVPITRSVTRAAISALRDLARVRPLHHRLPASDVLIAAAAADVGIGVLHYDRHYDRLAEVLPFESRWIAPPGSL